MNIEPIDMVKRTEEIKEKAMFPILELIPLLEKMISKKVIGNVIVMIGSMGGITVRIANKEFVFGYSFERIILYECSIERIVDDCLYHYKKEIVKRYIKEEGMIE